MKIFICIMTIWVLLAYINTGFLLAEAQGRFPRIAKEYYRSDLSFAVFVSCIPVTWIVTPFMTGFYEFGWMRPTLTRSEKHD